MGQWVNLHLFMMLNWLTVTEIPLRPVNLEKLLSMLKMVLLVDYLQGIMATRKKPRKYGTMDTTIQGTLLGAMKTDFTGMWDVLMMLSNHRATA